MEIISVHEPARGELTVRLIINNFKNATEMAHMGQLPIAVSVQ